MAVAPEIPAWTNDFNRKVAEDFRANDGKVGPPFEGAPMILLWTTGAKSGKTYLAPLVYQADGDRVLIFASKAGAPTNPDWYHNLVANPTVTVEVATADGIDLYEATASELEGEERDRLFRRQVELMPGFGDYEAKTSRKIPVIAITRN
jgi:deazaflavin-dependent oxidoreductase (nitroreductase family)